MLRVLFFNRSMNSCAKVSPFDQALQSLIEFYAELTKRGIDTPNQAEFQAYYILTHAWSNDIVSNCEKLLPKNVFLDPQVQIALQLRAWMTQTNQTRILNRASVDGSLNYYADFFRLLRTSKVSYLMACCVHIDFIEIRRSALKAMQSAYYLYDDDKDTGFLLGDLVRILGFDTEEDAITTLTYYDIGVCNVEGRMRCQLGRNLSVDVSGKKRFIPGKFTEDKRVSLAPRKSMNIVESKRLNMTDVMIINGLRSENHGIGHDLKTIASNPIVSEGKSSLLRTAEGNFPNVVFGSSAITTPPTSNVYAKAMAPASDRSFINPFGATDVKSSYSNVTLSKIGPVASMLGGPNKVETKFFPPTNTTPTQTTNIRVNECSSAVLSMENQCVARVPAPPTLRATSKIDYLDIFDACRDLVFADFIRDQVYQSVRLQLQESQVFHEMIPVISVSIYSELIENLINEFTVESVEIQKDIDEFRTSLSKLAEDIIDDFVQESISEH